MSVKAGRGVVASSMSGHPLAIWNNSLSDRLKDMERILPLEGDGDYKWESGTLYISSVDIVRVNGLP